MWVVTTLRALSTIIIVETRRIQLNILFFFYPDILCKINLIIKAYNNSPSLKLFIKTIIALLAILVMYEIIYFIAYGISCLLRREYYNMS